MKISPLSPRLLRLLPALAVLGLAAIPVHAQDAEERDWEVNAELGASTFFGASDQTSLVFAGTYTQEKENLEWALTSGFTYGEAQAQGDAEPVVNQRSWTLGGEVDYSFGRWSPFAYLNGEGSLVRQIDLRLAGGVGAKYAILDTDRTKFDVSAAIQAERTDPRVPEGVEVDAVTLARSNNRVRFVQKFGDDRAEFSQLVFYKPALGDSEDYTVDTETSLGINLNSVFSFKISLVNRYDNLAESRGAVSNNDGRLFFSVLAAF